MLQKILKNVALLVISLITVIAELICVCELIGVEHNQIKYFVAVVIVGTVIFFLCPKYWKKFISIMENCDLMIIVVVAWLFYLNFYYYDYNQLKNVGYIEYGCMFTIVALALYSLFNKICNKSFSSGYFNILIIVFYSFFYNERPYWLYIMLVVAGNLFAQCRRVTGSVLKSASVSLLIFGFSLLVYVAGSKNISNLITGYNDRIVNFDEDIENGLYNLMYELMVFEKEEEPEKKKLFEEKDDSDKKTNPDKYIKMDGFLSNISPKKNEKQVDVVVLMNRLPFNNMYLRGFIGDTYKSGGWSEIDNNAFETELSKWETDNYSHQEIKSRILNRYYMRSDEPVTDVTIEYKINSKYRYIPYGTAYFGRDIYGDGELYNKNNIKSEELRVVLSDSYYMNSDVFNSDIIESQYAAYVNNQYLDCENMPESIKNICYEKATGDFNTDMIFILNYLWSNCDYNLDTKNWPDNINNLDYVDYFLLESKEGWCEHFATAATLMFRYMGYPARFVGGYLVERSKFGINSEGRFYVEVTNDKAHAWTEVFVNGVWYPVDATEPTVIRKNTENTTVETETIVEEEKPKRVEKPQIKPASPEEKEANNGNEADDGHGKGFILMLLVTVGSVTVGFVVILFARRFVVLGIRKLRFKHMSINDRTQEAYRYCKKCLKYIDGKVDVNERELTDIKNIQELAKKARFSKQGVSGKEAELAVRAVRKFGNKVYDELSLVEKFKWKFINCL